MDIVRRNCPCWSLLGVKEVNHESELLFMGMIIDRIGSIELINQLI